MTGEDRSPRFVGIKITGGRGGLVEENDIQGADEAIVGINTTDLIVRKNIIRAKVPQNVIDSALTKLHEINSKSGETPTVSDAEKAAVESGLKNWLIEHGVDVANLGATVLAMFVAR